MKLYVARHGQTQYNLEKRICGRADVPLTKRGIMQAHELAEIMKVILVDKDPEKGKAMVKTITDRYPLYE